MEKVKKPIFKKWWFWVIIIVVVLAIIGGTSGGEDTTDSGDDGTQVSTPQTNDTNKEENKKEESKKEEIKYEAVDLQTLLDELDANALKAEKTYQNKQVEVTGKIASFDSDGSYITIEPVNASEWNFDTVMCDIKNDEQLNFLLEKVKGDTVTIKGKITSIGEVLGYTIKIAEVK